MACANVYTGYLDNQFDNFDDQKDEVIVLQSIFADTGKLMIESNAENREDDLYTLCINVEVSEVNEDGIVLNAWKPFDETEIPLSKANSDQVNFPLEQRPSFQRSESDSLWQEVAGAPIIYTWIDWLENNTLSHLGLEKCVVLNPHSASSYDHVAVPDDSEVDEVDQLDSASVDSGARRVLHDPRALPECFNIESDLHTLLRFNSEKLDEVFKQSSQLCEICFDEKLGHNFFCIKECGHHFCHYCVIEYVQMHVSDGSVQQLVCLDRDCKIALPPSIIRTVLGQEAFHRWERLLLQKTLEGMGDVVWCPRCNQPVITEEQENLKLAHCTHCFYSFCTQCDEAWHGGSQRCKGIEEQLQELREESKKDAETSNGRLTREQRERNQRRWQEYLSKSHIRKTAKLCPSCRVPIEKNMGCNLVTCSQCRNKMCWICGAKIRGYDHFGKCVLFEAPDAARPPQIAMRQPNEAQERINMELFINPEIRRQISLCPKCRQRNLKENRNNHLRCWSCKTNFCFMCKSTINGTVTAHFRAPSPCIQHTDV